LQQIKLLVDEYVQSSLNSHYDVISSTWNTYRSPR